MMKDVLRLGMLSAWVLAAVPAARANPMDGGPSNVEPPGHVPRKTVYRVVEVRRDGRSSFELDGEDGVSRIEQHEKERHLEALKAWELWHQEYVASQSDDPLERILHPKPEPSVVTVRFSSEDEGKAAQRMEALEKEEAGRRAKEEAKPSGKALYVVVGVYVPKGMMKGPASDIPCCPYLEFQVVQVRTREEFELVTSRLYQKYEEYGGDPQLRPHVATMRGRFSTEQEALDRKAVLEREQAEDGTVADGS